MNDADNCEKLVTFIYLCTNTQHLVGLGQHLLSTPDSPVKDKFQVGSKSLASNVTCQYSAHTYFVMFTDTTLLTYDMHLDNNGLLIHSKSDGS